MIILKNNIKKYYFNVFFIKKISLKNILYYITKHILNKKNLEVQISNDNLRKYSSKKN